ncbi:MAG: hypothetical protein IJY92_01305 [Alphaproteobacteria bacterium]|nr:hypothetical protein [Alphaproteobacteria bacterium]
MQKSNLLLPLFVLGLVGCDKASEKKYEFMPPIETALLLPEDEVFANIKGGEALAISADSPATKHISTDPEIREFYVPTDEAESSYYDILVLSDGSKFDITKDGKLVLSSEQLPQDKLLEVTPLMKQVADKILLIEQASDKLSSLTPEGMPPLAKFTQSESNRNIITKTRMKYRVMNAEKEIVSLIDQSIQMVTGVALAKENTSQHADNTAQTEVESEASVLLPRELFSSIEFSDASKNLYEIAVSKNAEAFEVRFNSKVVLKSDDLTPEEFQKAQPVMLGVLENINQIAKDEESLILISPKTRLGLPLKTDENKNVITRTRLEARVDGLKNDILKDVSKLIEQLEKEKPLPQKAKEIETPIKIKTPSSAEKRLSLLSNRLSHLFQRV